MTAQQLKNSILQMAVQGKLVSQDPNDEPASVLLERIREEKAQLIKEGKIKKEKNPSRIFRGADNLPYEQIGKNEPVCIADEVPFEIPDSWEWVRLKCIAIINPRNDLSDDIDVAFIPMPLLMDGYRNEHSFETKKWKEVKGGFTHFAENDIVVAKITPCFQNRKSAILHNLPNGFGAGTTELHVVRKVSNSINNEYLLWIFKSTYFIDNGVKAFSGTAGQQRVGKPYMDSLLIPLPPLEEQKRIVEKIQEVMPFCSDYEKADETLDQLNTSFPDQLKKSILQWAVQGKLVEQRPEDGDGKDLLRKLENTHGALKPCKDELNFNSMDFDIPKNWGMAELNEIFDFVDYRGKTPHNISEGVFLVTASNIKNGYMDYSRKEYISETEYETRKSRGITEKGDLLFTTEAPMGNAALCDLNRCSCGQRIITFKEYCLDVSIPELYMYFILSPQFQQQLLDNCTGTTAKGIKADKLKHFRIPVPPYAEQIRILEKLKELLPFCERLKYGL